MSRNFLVLTFFDLLHVVFQAVKPATKCVILQVQLRERSSVTCARGMSDVRPYHREPSEQLFHKMRDFDGLVEVPQRHRVHRESGLCE